MHLGVCIIIILSSLDQWALQIATQNYHLRQSQLRSDHPSPLFFPRRAASQPPRIHRTQPVYGFLHNMLGADKLWYKFDILNYKLSVYDGFKVVSPTCVKGKSRFRKSWPVGFVCTIPLLFCVYICT